MQAVDVSASVSYASMGIAQMAVLLSGKLLITISMFPLILKIVITMFVDNDFDNPFLTVNIFIL